MAVDASTARCVTWRKGGALPGESLWSVTHKFCALNYVAGPGFMRSFGKARSGKHSNARFAGARSYPTTDLRFADSLDLEAFAAAVGDDGFCCQDAIVQSWGNRTAIRAATADFLRYCPTCIELGFHSAVLQFTSIRECPLHRDLVEDSCPKCGGRIPYRLPTPSGQPYSCPCGRHLWWGVDKPEWPRVSEAEELSWLFSRVGAGLRLKFGGARDSDYPSGLVWQREGGLTAHDWDRLLTKSSEGPEYPIGSAVIWRQWDSVVLARPRRTPPTDSVYAHLLRPEDGFGNRLFDLFRRIDRALVRRFPAARRKRCMATLGPTSFYLRDCDAWEREYIALRLWRTYWGTSTWRFVGRKRQDETERQKRLPETRVFWRFLQHARALRPQWRIDAVDEWVQLHFFAVVAFATYEAARKLIHGSNLWAYPFRTNRCEALEVASVPFAVVARKPTKKPMFELRVLFREDLVQARRAKKTLGESAAGDSTDTEQETESDKFAT